MVSRTALIVGGLGGIGRAIANGLRKRQPGWRILATSSDGREGSITLDVTNQFSVQNARTFVLNETKMNNAPLQFVINCTGLLHDEHHMPERSFKNLEMEFLLKNLAVHTLGWALIAREFAPLLIDAAKAQQKDGTTCENWPANPLLATISARVGSITDNKLGGWYSYRCSKAAQNQLTKTLSIELKRKNVICMALHPGTVATDLSQPFQKGVPEGKLFSPEQSAGYLLDVMSKSSFPDDCGKFYDWSHVEIPW